MRIRAPKWFEQFRICRFFNEIKCRLKVERWKKRGRSLPPPSAFKQNVLREYARRYRLSTLVETGTLHGDTIFRLVDNFKKIYSIELSEALFAKARRRFRWFRHVHLIQGDSGAKMGEVVAQLQEPALFWLDGHYSGGETACGDLETPIFQELLAIFNGSDHPHILLIDDARCFGVDPDYPTIDRLRSFVAEHRPGLSMEVADDIIRFV